MNLVIIKDGSVKITGPGEVKADGTVRIHGKPIVLRALCAEAGVDPAQVYAKGGPANLLGKLGMNAGAVEIITDDEHEARQRSARLAAERALELQVPGLSELRALERAAARESDRFHREFGQMMDDEQNDGVNPPRPEDRSIGQRLTEMKKSNSRAALYLRAERQAQGSTEYSATSGAMAAGRKAMEILTTGGAIEEAERALAVRYTSDSWN